MDRRIDIAVAAAFALLGLLMILGATGIREGMMRDPIGPRAAFYACGAMLAIGGGIVILGHLRRWRQQSQHMVRAEGSADEAEFPASALRAWVLMGTAGLYAALFEPLGFLIATPLFLIAALWIMGKRSPVSIGLIAVIFTVATYLIFAQGLGVRIPVGPLTPLFRSLGWVNL